MVATETTSQQGDELGNLSALVAKANEAGPHAQKIAAQQVESAMAPALNQFAQGLAEQKGVELQDTSQQRGL